MENYKLLEDVITACQSQLSSISSYVEERNLQNCELGLGFLPSLDFFYETLESQGWEAESAIELAQELQIIFPKKAGGFFCPYIGRLIFPIRDIYGRAVGFSGRTLSNEKPKYINTHFKKGKHLYGLDLAYQEIIRLNVAAIVEGYTDVIACRRLGFKNVVAVMGTAITRKHINLLSRYTDRLVVLLDDDVAGSESSRKFLKEKAPDPLVMKVFQKFVPHGYNDIDKMAKDAPLEARSFLKETLYELR